MGNYIRHTVRELAGGKAGRINTIFFIKTGLVVASVVLSILAAELVARAALPRIYWQYSGKSNARMTHCYRPAAFWGYEMVPNSAPDINALGMRDKEYSLTKPPLMPRVLLLGDSITEVGRWSDYVEQKLQADGPCELLNAAVSGWNMIQYHSWLMTKGGQFSPDVVMLGLCLNDLDPIPVPTLLVNETKTDAIICSLNGRNASGADTATQHINPALFSCSFLYRWLALHKASRKAAENEWSLATHVERLADMKTVAQGRLLAIVFPYLKPLSAYDASERKEYSDMLSALTAAGVDYLDLTPYFNQFSADELVAFRSDPKDKIHYNDQANRLKADIIYPWLRDRIPRPPKKVPA